MTSDWFLIWTNQLLVSLPFIWKVNQLGLRYTGVFIFLSAPPPWGEMSFWVDKKEKKEKKEKAKEGNRNKEGKRWFLAHTENKQNSISYFFPRGKEFLGTPLKLQIFSAFGMCRALHAVTLEKTNWKMGGGAKMVLKTYTHPCLIFWGQGGHLRSLFWSDNSFFSRPW